MSEFTPTTQDVRQVYVEAAGQASFPSQRLREVWERWGGAAGEFDRWLAGVIRTAKAEALGVVDAYLGGDFDLDDLIRPSLPEKLRDRPLDEFTIDAVGLWIKSLAERIESGERR